VQAPTKSEHASLFIIGHQRRISRNKLYSQIKLGACTVAVWPKPKLTGFDANPFRKDGLSRIFFVAGLDIDEPDRWP
jgi:hypothetical protein